MCFSFQGEIRIAKVHDTDLDDYTFCGKYIL